MATITLTCPACGISKEVPDYPSRIRKYCSRACNGIAQIKDDAKTPYLGSTTSVYNHRIIVEKAIGMKLPKGAVVHHHDGNGRNNAHTNLVVCGNQSYHRLLHTRQRVIEAGGDPDTMKFCGRCKQLLTHSSFTKERSAADGLHGWCKVCVMASRNNASHAGT